MNYLMKHMQDILLRTCRNPILGMFLSFFGFACLIHSNIYSISRGTQWRVIHSAEGGINRTLGFEKIAVVTSGLSWRLEGILAAAERTDLILEIVAQPKWTTKEVDLFRGTGVKGRKSEMGPGQAQCWMGHLNVLKEMLLQKWSTVLIMEDDCDWDINIKQQLAAVAPMVRDLLNTTDADVRVPSAVSDHLPYGLGWDLLWLGHCGDGVPQSPEKVVTAMDPTMPESPLYRQTYGGYIYHAPQLRVVHWSTWPVCTYAYAVTWNGAMKIYRAARGGRDHIITKDLRSWCLDGTLRCVTVNPELFHHHKTAGKPSSEIAVVEGWENLSELETVGYTANIKYSARCNSKSKTLVRCQYEEETTTKPEETSPLEA